MKAKLKKTSQGFTLIELLVSMVITTIIVTVLVTITVTSLDMWNRNRAEVRASLQSKAMVDAMAADFESMVVRRGNDFQWLFAKFDGEGEDYTGDVDDGPNGNLSPSALDLIFFSAATDRYDGQVGDPTEDKGGDISTIAYQLVYKDPISDLDEEKFKTFALYRKIVSPKPTFDSLLGQANLKTAFDTLPADPDLTDQNVDALENFVCENVYQFTVRFNVDIVTEDPLDNTKTITKQVAVSVNDGESFIVTGNGLDCPAVSGVDPDELASGRLSSVEVSLTVLTDFGIKQLRGRTLDEDELSDFIAENSFQYSKLIPVPSY